MKDDKCKPLTQDQDAKKYLRNVWADYRELKNQYPFSRIVIPPTGKPYEIMIVTIAVGKDIIEDLHAFPDDFTKEYSKRIEVVVPYDYQEDGCRVYGGAWIDISKLKADECHMLDSLNDGRYRLCIGVPASFAKQRNAILESVRTADNYLVAYERYQKGLTDHLNLIAYAHGLAGIIQYEKDTKRYTTK